MAETAAAPAPAAAPRSPIAGIKAYLSAQAAPPQPEADDAPETEETSGIANDAPAEESTDAPDKKSEKPATPKKDAAPKEEETETEDEGSDEDDVEAVVAQLSSLKDLVEATGVDLDKLLDSVDFAEKMARLSLPGHLLRAGKASQTAEIPKSLMRHVMAEA